MKFTDSEYTTADFRKVERFYTNFWYNEVSTAPGLTWCTEYYYKKMKADVYRYVQVDAYDDEMYLHEELSLKEFIETINMEEQLEDYIDDEVISLFPEDFQPYGLVAKPYFNELKANLLLAAHENNDKKFVQALLPDFDELRKELQFFDLDNLISLELERERTVDGRLLLYFSYEKAGDSFSSDFTYHYGDNYIIEDNEVFFIGPETVDFLKKVYGSEYQCFPDLD